MSGQKSELYAAPFWHTNDIMSCDVSSDGSLALAGDYGGRMVLWDLVTKRGIRAFKDETLVQEVKFIGDNQELAISLHNPSDSFYKLVLWRLSSSVPLDTIAFQSKGPVNIACNGGRKIIISTSQSAFLVEVSNQRFSHEKVLKGTSVFMAYFSANATSEFKIVISPNGGNRLVELSYDLQMNLVDSTYLPFDNREKNLRLFGETVSYYNGAYVHLRDLQRGLHDSIAISEFELLTDIGSGRVKLNDLKFSRNGNLAALAFGNSTSFHLARDSTITRRGYGAVAMKEVGEASYTWKSSKSSSGERESINQLTWIDEDQQLLSVSNDGTLIISEVSSGGVVAALDNPNPQVVFYDIGSKFDYIYYAKRAKYSGFWDLDSDQGTSEYVDTTNVHVNGIYGEERFLTAQDYGYQNYLKIWSDGQPIFPPGNIENAGFQDIMFALSSRQKDIVYISGRERGRNHWNLSRDSFEEGVSREFLDVEKTNAGDTLSYDSIYTNVVKLNISTGKALVRYQNEDNNIEELYASKNERFLAGRMTSSDSSHHTYYKIINTESGTQKSFGKSEGVEIIEHSFSDYDSKAATYFSDGTYMIWNTSDESVLKKGVLTGGIDDFIIREQENQIVIIRPNGTLELYNYATNTKSTHSIGTGKRYTDALISENGKYLYLKELEGNDYIFFNLGLDKIIGAYDVSIPFKFKDYYKIHRKHCHFLPNEFAVTGDDFGRFQLWDLQKEKLVAHLQIFEHNGWAVYTDHGTFSGNKAGRDKMYYVVGQEVIEFKQLQDRYWVPKLLDKILNRTYDESLHKSLNEAPLYPTIEMEKSNNPHSLDIYLNERSGGIGKVHVFINNVERIVDLNLNGDSLMRKSLKDIAPFLVANMENTISVEAFDASNSLHSRRHSINIDLMPPEGINLRDHLNNELGRSAASLVGREVHPQLHAIFIGTSDYGVRSMNLSFPDKDAAALESSIKIIAEGVFRKEDIHTYRLTSSTSDRNMISSKSNVIDKFSTIESKANPTDVVLVFLSGHGITIGDDFYYLTKDLAAQDVKDTVVQKKFLISSREIKNSLRKIKANKQILILDACHSGQAAQIFSGAKSSGTSQQKILENLENKSGIYLLASSEGDQKSYESHELKQGILTYSLLMGIGGGLPDVAEDDPIFIQDLLSYASKESEGLARDIQGKIQIPILSTAKGATSFPIGRVTKKFKFELPKGKSIKFGAPRIGLSPSIGDPENVESDLKKYLKEKGAFGSDMEFLYWDSNTDPDVFSITGTYKKEEDSISLNLFLLKGQELYPIPVGYDLLFPNEPVSYPLSFSGSLNQKELLFDAVVSQMLKIVEANLQEE